MRGSLWSRVDPVFFPTAVFSVDVQLQLDLVQASNFVAVVTGPKVAQEAAIYTVVGDTGEVALGHVGAIANLSQDFSSWALTSAFLIPTTKFVRTKPGEMIPCLSPASW